MRWPKRSYEEQIEHYRNYVFNRSKLNADGCWIWQARKDPSGYSRVGIKLEDNYNAGHRLSYRVFKGEIPLGYHIDHVCRIKDCVNPRHLEALTPSAHMGKPRGPKGVCRNGHTKPPGRCPTCVSIRTELRREPCRRYHLENRVRILERKKEYYLENKESIRAKNLVRYSRRKTALAATSPAPT